MISLEPKHLDLCHLHGIEFFLVPGPTIANDDSEEKTVKRLKYASNEGGNQ